MKIYRQDQYNDPRRVDRGISDMDDEDESSQSSMHSKTNVC